MTPGATNGDDAACLAIEGEMTIYRAAELQPALLDLVRAQDAPTLDLSAVTEFDSAGLQLLLVARKEAARLGKMLRVRATSPAVDDLYALLGIANEIPAEGVAA